MTDLILPLLILTRGLRTRAAHGFAHRHDEDGLGTLEMVIITVGLVTVAGLLVAAITAAVTSRTSQIK